MKQHVGLRLYWRQGLVFCLPENSLLCRAARRAAFSAVSFRAGSTARLVMYDIRIGIEMLNARREPTFRAEYVSDLISTLLNQIYNNSLPLYVASSKLCYSY